MKVSFICTVLNEEKTIDKFLDSLMSQSRLPDEIVICDGGSSDLTVEKIKNYPTSSRRWRDFEGARKFRILERKGLNRSQGRNEAIKKVTGDVIAVSDAGCILDKKWLEEIAKPFEKDKTIDVVGGFYLPTGSSTIQKILGVLTSVPIEEVNPDTFLPSSRSIAFKKEIWELAGGYPEDNRYNEDLVFAQRLKNLGAYFSFSQKAIVFWPQRETTPEAIKQFFNYAIGDGMAGINGPHFWKLFFKSFLLLFLIISCGSGLRLIILLIFLFLFFLIKAARLTVKLREPRVFPAALVLTPLLNLVVFFGFVFGFIKNLERLGEKQWVI